MKAIAGLFLGTMLVCANSFAQAEEIPWHSNYGDALQEARETGKPLLVAFRCVP